jgi:putative ABC transport system substrate-binding protein
MNRRAALVTLPTLAYAAFVRCAQGAGRVRRIGSLGLGILGSPEELQRVWAPARELGWIEGQNLLVERRWTTDPERLAAYAKELVRLDVELIITNGTAATLAAKAATTQIPIVMHGSAVDPIDAGLARDLARPGGNVTGYSSISAELTAKRIEILRELLPSVRRVGVLIYPSSPVLREEAMRLCRSFGLEPVILEAPSASALVDAITEATRQRATALIIRVGGTTGVEDAALMRAAIANSLPTVTNHKVFVDLGGMASLMADESEQNRILAYYLDRILRGARPSDLPIQQPTRFVLSINLKSAKALGVTVPASVRARADDLIQ